MALCTTYYASATRFFVVEAEREAAQRAFEEEQEAKRKEKEAMEELMKQVWHKSCMNGKIFVALYKITTPFSVFFCFSCLKSWICSDFYFDSSILLSQEAERFELETQTLQEMLNNNKSSLRGEQELIALCRHNARFPCPKLI